LCAYFLRVEAVRLIIFVACSMVGSLIVGSILLTIPAGAWALIRGIIVVGFVAAVVIQSARLILGD
jgi:hypothetical protein